MTHEVGEQVDRHLARIYPHLNTDALTTLRERVLASAGVDGNGEHELPPSLPSEDEVMLITYGDTVIDGDSSGLVGLQELLDGPFAGVFSSVHVLPFFASSSDGGFSIVDYREIGAGIGEWEQVRRLGSDRDLMVDLVCNHGSAQSEWFQQFIADQAPGNGFYVTADEGTDVSSVVRPRTHPLLLPVETAAGTRHAWATFSNDQVDFDFANPDVLVEFCSIIDFYLANGATRVRLDAIAYLWKELGTSCVHLPQTHEVVKLFRTLVSARDANVLLITETNVPHAQNVSYFGDGDEAQIVYNFSLAPLIAWSVLAEDASVLTGWLGRLDPPPPGCSFLNFLASHDGIGLRPIEDLVAPDQLQVLLDRATETGGDWSNYSAPGGPRPYELNVSLADLLAGVVGEYADRFVAAHAAMLAVQGIPAIYVHSVLSSPGDLQAVAATEHKRDINRSRLERSAIDERLASGWRAQVFASLAALITTRRDQSAFSPSADQVVHVLDRRVASIERIAPDQRLLAIQNMSSESVPVTVPGWCGQHDLVSGTDRSPDSDTITLAPWQTVWLT